MKNPSSSFLIASVSLLFVFSCSNERNSGRARATPDWVKKGILLEVSIQTFSKEGTFRGAQQSLSRAKALGAGILCLQPIHPFGELNRREGKEDPYAVQDYYEVNPRFGTIEDFKSFVRSAQNVGMKVIVDFVGRYAAWDSRLVQEHSDWFTKNEEGAMVSPDSVLTGVADLNYDGHELRKYMLEVMKFWVRETGIDGFRCIAANRVPVDFWNTARKQLDAIKPVLMISDGSDPEYHREAFDVTYDWAFYRVFSEVLKGTVSPAIFDTLLAMESRTYPAGSLRIRPMRINNLLSRDDGIQADFTTRHMYAALQHVLPGIPVLRYEDSNSPQSGTFFTTLAGLRTGHAALVSGTFANMSSQPPSVYAFFRELEGDIVAAGLNFSGSKVTWNPAMTMNSGRRYIELYSGKEVKSGSKGPAIEIRPRGFAVLVQK